MTQNDIIAKATERVDSAWAQQYEDFLVQDMLLDRFIETVFRDEVDYRSFKEGAAPSLLKPGAEKIRIFKGWQGATETQVHIGRKSILVQGTGEVYSYISETIEGKPPTRIVHGTGVAGYKPKDMTDFRVNAAIKMCGKRALVDATINAAGLSGRYTQDKTLDSDESDDLLAEPKTEAKPKPPSASERKQAWDDYLKSLPQEVQDDIQRMRDGINGAEDLDQLKSAAALIRELTEKIGDDTITKKVRSAYSAQMRKIKQKEG